MSTGAGGEEARRGGSGLGRAGGAGFFGPRVINKGPAVFVLHLSGRAAVPLRESVEGVCGVWVCGWASWDCWGLVAGSFFAMIAVVVCTGGFLESGVVGVWFWIVVGLAWKIPGT